MPAPGRPRPSGNRARPGRLPTANEQQTEHWNGDEAGHWAAHQMRYDTMLGPFAGRLVAAARIAGADVGCGCGATTVPASRQAPSGTAVGVDLSAVMLEAARRRAAREQLANVSFIAADGQTFAFAGGGCRDQA